MKIPIYFGDLTIYQVEDLKEIQKSHGLMDMHGFEACSFRDHDKGGYSKYFIGFTMDCNSRMIAHECLHLLALIFEDRGIMLEIENDEPQCYFLGWMVGMCHKYLKVDDSAL